MRGKVIAVLLLAALIGAGCSAAQLKANKDAAWNDFPRALPDSYDGNPSSYGHPFRGAAFALYPLGVIVDYIVVRPFYLLGGLGPEWFGLRAEDAVSYQQHLPEVVTPQSAPRRWE
jgi:hypothetical protein